mgnify:CR=1 FL=1
MLSYGQVRISLLQLYHSELPIYNMSFDINIKYNLDLVLFEKSNLVARELYYWGNSWYSKNFGGTVDYKSDFLGLDSFSYQLKYNKIIWSHWFWMSNVYILFFVCRMRKRPWINNILYEKCIK